MKTVPNNEVRSSQRFAANLYRIAGLHALNDVRLAAVLDLSPQAVSTWRHGRREPSGQAVLAISALFEIPPHLLWERDLHPLLPFLADQERFDRTEKRISKALRGLKAVNPDGTPRKRPTKGGGQLFET